MNAGTILPTRLRAAAPGLGEGSLIEVEQRAAELALSDGRERVSDGDLAQAAAELAGGGTTLEKPETGAAFHDVPIQTGHLDVAAALVDEDNIAEQLIENGLEEADHDTRIAAELECKDKR